MKKMLNMGEYMELKKVHDLIYHKLIVRNSVMSNTKVSDLYSEDDNGQSDLILDTLTDIRNGIFEKSSYLDESFNLFESSKTLQLENWIN